MNFYTLGVQRWPLPFFKRYQVVEHDWSEGETKLTLHCLDGSLLSVPRMDRRKAKIYPDYKIFLLSKKSSQPSAPEVTTPWQDQKS